MMTWGRIIQARAGGMATRRGNSERGAGVRSHKRWLLVLAMLSLALPVWAQDDDAEEDGRSWSFHGEVRLRGEYQNNYTDFNDERGMFLPTIPVLIEDDNVNFFPFRVRLGVQAQLSENLLGEVQIQAADAAGMHREQRDVLFSNPGGIDLYTGFIHWNGIGGSGTSMRFGRQEIVVGNEFFFGDLDFYNGISFDSYRLSWANDTARFDFWWARTNETFQADADTDIFTVNIGADADRGDSFDFYAHNLRDDEVSGTNRTDLLVIGARWSRQNGGSSHFVWNVEVAWQDGRIGNLDPGTGITGSDRFVSAWGGEGMFGYNWNSTGNNDHRVYGHAYLASGDRAADDNKSTEFNTLFQDFHDRLGKADIVQGTNITSVGVAYEGMFGEKHGVGVDIMAFLINRPMESATILASMGGRFDGFAIPATINNASLSGDQLSEDDLGQEIDLWYDYYYSKNVSFGVLAAVFLPGEAIAQVNAGFDDMAFRLSAQARLRF